MNPIIKALLLALSVLCINHAQASVPYIYCDEFYSSSFEYDPVGVGITEPYWECTYREPAYIEPVDIDGNRAAECWWTAEDYNGSRLDRGMEACSGNSTSELRFLEDGWYGLRLRVPSGDYPTDKDTIILQLFAHGRGGSWTGTLHIENNTLKIVHRSWLTTNHTTYVLDADIERDTWIPIIIYWKPSTNPDIGKVKVWYDGAPEGSPSYDYTGKMGFDAIDDGNGGWDDGWVDEDTMISGIGLKWGMYCADAANYTVPYADDDRTLYYDDVTQLKGNPVGAWDLVNPEADGRDAYTRIDNEYFSDQSGVDMETCSDVDGGLNLGYIQDGDWAAYYDVNFGEGANTFEARVASSGAGGSIEVRLDSIDGPLIGTCVVGNTGGWQDWVSESISISPVSGKRFVFLKFTGGSGYLFNINYFKFANVTGPGIEEEFTIGAGDITASGYQPGSTHVPANTVDGDLGTRWSAQYDGEWIRYDLGAEKYIHFLKIAWLSGDSRFSTFHVEASTDDATWNTITAGNVDSSGTTTALETVDVADTLARYVRIVGHGNSVNAWNSITEVEIWGTPASPPDVPADLAATPDDGQVSLSWTPSTGATLFHLKRSDLSGSGYMTIASEEGGSYLDTSVTNGTIYYYVISAENAAGESADSSEISAKPYAPLAPEELVTPAGIRNGNAMEFNVDSVSGRIYQLQKRDSLTLGDWIDVGDTVIGDGSSILLSDPDMSLADNRFYRLVIEP
ncbi:MAG: carbohydrate-binding protein [Opitutaceae bacterium]